MTQPDQPTDVYDHIAELARPHTTSEPYTIKRGLTSYSLTHRVRVPSLLRQLEHARPSGRGDDRSGAGYESRPAAALEAMAVLQTIDTGAGVWLRQLRPDTRTWGDTEDLLAALAGLVRGLEAERCHRVRLQHPKVDQVQPDGTTVKVVGPACCRFHEVARDIERWWTSARVAAGWDSRAWRPDNTCPMCGIRGGLRVKEADKVGMCVECHESWSPITIGLLAEHIRAENAAGRRTTAEAALCWCPFPQPVFERWPKLCPGCGSRYCHRAVDAHTAVAS